MKLEDMNIQQLIELKSKVDDFPEGLKLTRDGKPFDLEDYFFERIEEFFNAPEETVQQLCQKMLDNFKHDHPEQFKI